jgi:integrase
VVASIERRVRADGTTAWLARWRTPAGKSRCKTFERKRDAERHLTGVQASKHTGSYIDPAAGKLTVGKWVETWMATRVALKPKTIASYESLLRSQVLPVWASTPLSRVTHSSVTAWVASMRKAGLSASRTRQAYHLLTSMLDAAVADGRLARNPAAGVDLPRLPKTKRRYLDHDQVAALAGSCGRHRALVLVLAYGGLRWGEATALRAGRVDPLRRRLWIVEAIADVNGTLVAGSPKTHRHRQVVLPGLVMDELAPLLAGKEIDDLVFTSSTGTPLRVQNFRRDVFDAAAASVGLAGLAPHELRHTAASLAVASGASVKAVQAMLGHASAAMTLDVYTDLFDDELDGVAERLDRAAGAARAAGVSQGCQDGTVTPMTERKTSR